VRDLAPPRHPSAIVNPPPYGDMVVGIGAKVVPENAEGHRCCRGMNCCCASAAHKGVLVARTGEGGISCLVACSTNPVVGY